jgi:hypothetical protein
VTRASAVRKRWTSADVLSRLGHVCFTLEADVGEPIRHVGFGPIAEMKKGCTYPSQQATFCHSITSSARATSAADGSRSRALAVFKLITNSYLVGACTGNSDGFSPLRMRST